MPKTAPAPGAGVGVLPHANILGVPVSAIDLPTAVETIGQWIDQGQRHYVCVTNVHTIMECQNDDAIREVFHQAGMITPDGMPLVWVSRMMGQAGVQRVYGPDLMLSVLEESISRGWSHYFYGGAPGVASTLASEMISRFPGLRIAGLFSPPFRPLTGPEEVEVVNSINHSGADIVWTGIGAPRQEMWMARHRRQLNAPVLIGVGAAFDFLSGIKPQAPRWMMAYGLEWLFRLKTEPRRLWRRYLIYNPLFVWKVALQFAGLQRHSTGRA